MSHTNQPKPEGKPSSPPPTSAELLREVLTKLLEKTDQLPETDKLLGQRIRDLGIAAKDPAQVNQNSFQAAIAAAAQDFEKATGRQLDLASAQRAAVTGLTTATGAHDTASATESKQAGKPADATPPPSDPIRDLLTKLVSSLDQLPESAKTLGTKIRELDKEAEDPVRFNQKSVQHEVAYAAQDFEKATGRPLDITSNERAQVVKLAGGAPGLENGRLLGLLRSTVQVDDSGLVRDIRRYSAEVGQASNQNTADILSRVEAYENRVRQAPRVPETMNVSQEADSAAKREQSGPTQSRNGAINGARDYHGSQNDPLPGGRRNGTAEEPPPVQTAVLRGGVLDTLAAALRGNGQPKSAPWDPEATPFGDRVSAFQHTVDARDQDRAIGRVDNSARKALEALDGFRTSEGAAVMNRIQAAARAEPGGMASVLSEMRAGGRFGDLRQAFNSALNNDKGFAQAYDRAASALASYGQGREQVEQIIAKRPDAANLTAKFEQLDGQIGDKASNIPSRNEGKNMLDDISQTIAEIFQRATEKVRAMFTRTRGAGAGPSPAA